MNGAARTRSVRTSAALGATMALISCSPDGELTCRLDLTQSGQATARVTCLLRPGSGGPVAIKQAAQDALVRVSEFESFDSSGGPLDVTSRRDASPGASSSHFTERVIAHREGELTYRYVVRPGAPMGDEQRGSQGQQFGYLGPRGGLFSGRNVLLLPAAVRGISRIVIDVDLPEGWRLVGAPSPAAGGNRIEGSGMIGAAAMVEGIFGVGRFEEPAGGGSSNLRLYLGEGLAASDRETIVRVAQEGARHLDQALGRREDEYTLILIPPPAGDVMIRVPATTRGQASEISAAGPVQMHDLLYAMARARQEPAVEAGSTMLEAVPAFLAIDALDHLGVRSSRDSWLARAPAARQSRGALDSADRQASRTAGAFLLAAAARESGSGLPARWEASGRPFAGDPRWIEAVTGIHPTALAEEPPRAGGARADGPVRRLRLLVTANTRGMLEVCGCVARQSGGLARRETVRRRLLSHPDPLVLVDLGNAYPLAPGEPRLGRPDLEELRLEADLMARQGYAAAAIGHAEMLRGASLFRRLSGERPLPYVNGNLTAQGEPLAPSVRLTRAGPLRIAWVSSLAPDDYVGEHARFYEQHQQGMAWSDPVEAIAASAASARGRADLVVAIGCFPPLLALRLAREVSELDAVLSSESHRAALDGVISFPTDGESRLHGFLGPRFVFFSVGEGRWLEQIDLEIGPRGVRSARVRHHGLGEEVPDDPAFRGRLAALYEEMRQDPALAGEAGPVARRLPEEVPSAYIGAAACRPCHEESWRDWSATPHASAFATLLARHRNYAPRCIGCHVTGWGHESGYQFGDPTERLRHVQCEMCHGPGETHAASPAAFNIRKRPPREVCFECHRPGHSGMTAGNFEEYDSRVRHAPREAAVKPVTGSPE